MRGRVCLLALVLLGSATPAAAYVRTRSPVTCKLVAWQSSCIYVQPDEDLEQDNLTAAQVQSTIQAAITSWNERLLASSYMRLRYLPPAGPLEVDRVDQLQIIKFRRDRWCRPQRAGQTTPTCFDPAATAVTTVSFLNKPLEPALDGRIIDADIDMNAVNYRFYDATAGSFTGPFDGRVPVDLWNTMTHELGHVLGLEHPCRLDDAPVPECMTDEKGRPVPLCEDVEAVRREDREAQNLYETTMYPTSTSTETGRRLPKADDVAGVVDAYPQGRDPLSCLVPPGVTVPGCAAAPARASGAGFVGLGGLVLGAMLGARLWRRRTRRQNQIVRG